MGLDFVLKDIPGVLSAKPVAQPAIPAFQAAPRLPKVNTVSRVLVENRSNKLHCKLSYIAKKPKRWMLTIFSASDPFQVARNNAVYTG